MRRGRGPPGAARIVTLEVRRVVVADDSSLFVEVLCALIDQEPGLALVAAARDGREAVRAVRTHAPDLVVMDVMMPELDGLAAAEEIMATTPTPILVLSSDPRSHTGRLSLEALARGALDVMPKPERLPFAGPEARALLSRMHLLAGVPVVRHVRGRRHQWRSWPRGERPPSTSSSAALGPCPWSPPDPSPVTRVVSEATPRRPPLVALAASTGGPPTLGDIMARLSSSLGAALLVVQHLSAPFLPVFVTWLRGRSDLEVALATVGAMPRRGCVYVAPAGHHLELDAEGRLALPLANGGDAHCPSADRLFSSMARHAPHRSLGVVLTGMGRDGTAGLLALRRAGGATAAQDGSSAVVDGMPGSARRAGAVDAVWPRDVVALELTRWVQARTQEVR
ncbi:MAG: chemotaxis protein CheB [Myxococcota bacterium]